MDTHIIVQHGLAQFLCPSQPPYFFYSAINSLTHPTAVQNKFSRTFRSARLAITKWKLSEIRSFLQKGWLSLKTLVSRGLKNPLISVNLLHCCCHAMLAPVFPWHPVLSVCIFVGTCSFEGWVAKWDFPPLTQTHQEVQEGKDKKDPPLSINKR